MYGHQENERKEIKINDNYRNKSVSQINFISLAFQLRYCVYMHRLSCPFYLVIHAYLTHLEMECCWMILPNDDADDSGGTIAE